MARKKRRRSSGFNISSVKKLLRMGALVAPGLSIAVGPGEPRAKVDAIFKRYSGFDMADGKFKAEFLLQGWGPFIATTLVTYGVGKLASFIRRL